jgi:hypothetical protein
MRARAHVHTQYWSKTFTYFSFGNESGLKKSCLPVSFLAACDKNVHIMFSDIKKGKKSISYTYRYQIKTTDKEVKRDMRQKIIWQTIKIRMKN